MTCIANCVGFMSHTACMTHMCHDGDGELDVVHTLLVLGWCMIYYLRKGFSATSWIIINAKWSWLRKILCWMADVQQPCHKLCLETWCKCVSQLYICSQPLRLNLGENIAATPASVSPDIVGVRRQRLIPWRIRRASESSYGSGDVDGGVNKTFF